MSATVSGLTLQQAKEKIFDVRRKCGELRKSGAFTMTEVEKLSEEVGPIFNDLWAGNFGSDVEADKQLVHGMEDLFDTFFGVTANLENCSEDQWPVYEELTTIYRGLDALRKNPTISYDASDVAGFQDRLNAIDSKRVDGKFFDANGNVFRGQGMLTTIMEKSYRITHQLLVRLEESM